VTTSGTGSVTLNLGTINGTGRTTGATLDITLRPGVMDWSGARELQIPDSGGRTLAEAALCARGSDIAAIFPASSLPKAGFRPMVTRASLKIAVLAIGK